MKSKNAAEPCAPSQNISSPPSDAPTVAERGREIAELLLRGLQESVLTEQEQERRQDRATRALKGVSTKSRRKKPVSIENI
jgi:hypothetical protein